MPTYVYACKNCGHRFEKYQSFSEDSLVSCPECGQDALRKVFDSVGVVFNSTDAKSAGASTAASSSSESSSAASTSSTPAAAPAAASSSSSSTTQAASS